MANIIHCEKRENEDMTMETIQELEHLKPKEWLTTGQMIDRLKVGEIAESKAWETWVIRVEHAICECDEKGKPISRLKVDNQILDTTWRILPKFVIFEEATQAYKNGKTITCYYPSVIDLKECSQSFSLDVTNHAGDLSFHMIVNGKWSIDE
jgi:hypothetical protein